MTTSRSTGLLVSGVMLASLAACGGGAATTVGKFNVQNNRPLSCMAHQNSVPAAADHPGKSEDPSRVLGYLHYYTVNGNKPYCDGHSATSVDRQWLDLYVAGGATRSHVTRALAGD
jgi:hypothetical protein